MNLPSLAIRRRVTFLMVFLLMAGAGVFGITQLGLDYLPRADLGKVVVITVLPGAGPEEVETLVSDVLEDAVSGVGDVDCVESESRASLSSVTVEASLGADIDQVLDDVKEAVDRSKSLLPSNATDPVVFALESSMKPLMIVSFTGETMSSAELRRLVDDEVRPVLSRVGGVSTADIVGGEVRRVNVIVDPVLIWDRGISIAQIYGILSAVSADQPGGNLEAGGLDISMSVRSGFHDLDQIRELVVGAHGGVPVRLGDVAVVEDGFEKPSSISSLDGNNTIMLVFRKSADANTVNTCRSLEDAVNRISASYAGQFETGIVYSQEDYVKSSMNSLLESGIQAMVLTAIVLLLFLGSPVNAGIVSITMPLSFVTTFAFMYVFDVNLNIVSLAGLSIAIGMIVDNSVVVLENIHRLRKDGAGVKEGAERGGNQVGMAIAASTLTTVAVFIPMLFVKGITGQVFRDLSITISCALMISLFNSMTFVPLLASMSPRIVKTHRKGSPLLAVQNLIQRLEERYAGWLAWCFSHRRLTLLATTGVFAASLLLMSRIPTTFIPDMQEGTMSVMASAPPGTSLDVTDSIANAMVDSIRTVIDPGDLAHTSMTVGRGAGISAVFGADASNRIDLTFYFAPEKDLTRPMDDYQAPVREILDAIPGLTYTMTTGINLAAGDPIQIALYESNLHELRVKGELVEQALARIPGTIDRSSSLDEWVDLMRFTPDPAVMSQRGVNPAALAAELTIGIMGLDASTYYEGDEDVNIHLSFDDRAVSSRERILGLPVSGAPLESWGTLHTDAVPNMIWHRDRSRGVMVSCGIEGRALGDVGKDVCAMMDTLDLGGSRWELLGTIPEQKESFSSMAIAIGAAIFLVYLVMAVQFESLKEPFLLIFEIPMAMIGVILVHALTGMTLGLTSLVGILMLAGLVVNNGILLVDFANQEMRAHGLSPAEAMLDAGRKRLRPILMTAGTTVFALLPLALMSTGSSGLWSPMARTVVGGMVVATPLTLLVLPVMYVVMAGRRSCGKGADDV